MHYFLRSQAGETGIIDITRDPGSCVIIGISPDYIPRTVAGMVNGKEIDNKDSLDIIGRLVPRNEGGTEALDHFMGLVYPELRRIERQNLKRQGADVSVESSVLAYEAYLKLVQPRVYPRCKPGAFPGLIGRIDPLF